MVGVRHSPLDRKTVTEPWSWLGTHDAMGPDRLCPRVRTELTTGRSWPPSKVPDGRRKANVAPILRKVYVGYYRLVSLTPVPGKATEQVLLEDISRHTKHEAVIKNSMALPRANCA